MYSSTRRTFLKTLLAGAGAAATQMLPKPAKTKVFESGIEVHASYEQPGIDYVDKFDIRHVRTCVRHGYNAARNAYSIDVHKPLEAIHLYMYFKDLYRCSSEVTCFRFPITMVTPNIAIFNNSTLFSKRTFSNLRACGVTWGNKKFCCFKVLGYNGWFYVNKKELIRDQLVSINKVPVIEYIKDASNKKQPFSMSVIGVDVNNLESVVYFIPS